MSKVGGIIGKIPVGTVIDVISQIAEGIRARRALRRRQKAVAEMLTTDPLENARRLEEAAAAERVEFLRRYRGGEP